MHIYIYNHNLNLFITIVIQHMPTNKRNLQVTLFSLSNIQRIMCINNDYKRALCIRKSRTHKLNSLVSSDYSDDHVNICAVRYNKIICKALLLSGRVGGKLGCTISNYVIRQRSIPSITIREERQYLAGQQRINFVKELLIQPIHHVGASITLKCGDTCSLFKVCVSLKVYRVKFYYVIKIAVYIYMYIIIYPVYVYSQLALSQHHCIRILCKIR